MAVAQIHFQQEAENVVTTYYAMKWFLMIFLDTLPFAVTVRIWDLFLFKGYNITYTIALSIMKMFESKDLQFFHSQSNRKIAFSPF
jgi:hypothetical protein